MKMLKALLLSCLLLFAVAPVYAQAAAGAVAQAADQSVEAQANAELQERLARMTDAEKAAALETIKAGPSSTAKKAQEWVEVGKGIGTGLGAAAKELGVAVNDFSKTTVGKLAMLLLIWHYMGDDISELLAGTIWLCIWLPLWFYQFRKVFGDYDETTGKFKGYNRIMLSEDSEHGVTVAIFIVSLIVIAGVGAVFLG